MRPMRYKGYSARIEYSDEDGCFVGRVAGIRDLLTFHGESVDEVRQAFKEALDFYLEMPHGASYRISPTRANSSCALPLKYTRR